MAEGIFYSATAAAVFLWFCAAAKSKPVGPVTKEKSNNKTHTNPEEKK